MPTVPETVVEFPSQATPKTLCTYNRCANGHCWVATISVTDCPGCKTPILAVMMEQCPICNEPTAALHLRTDHINRGGGIAAQCQGQQNSAEVAEVVMERTHAAEVERLEPSPEEVHARAIKPVQATPVAK